MSQTWVVTTSALGTSKTQIWNPDRPLPLGHPFQWVLEKTDRGMRVRDISGTQTGIQRKTFQEIPLESLTRGAQLELSGKAPLSLKIRPVTFLPPAFHGREGENLVIFFCSGDWVISSTTLNESARKYVGQILRQNQFTIEREQNGEYKVLCLASQIQLKTSTTTELKKGESLNLRPKELASATILVGNHTWKLGLASQPSIPALPEAAARAASEQVDNAAFRSALRMSAIGFVVFLAMSYLWPKPATNPQEIIPAQYAKLLLQKPKTSASAPKGGADHSTAPTEKVATSQNIPKKVQNSAVVQAFRAKALSNAVNGLLKGGMTRLLSQSDFVTGSQANREARRIFDTKSNDLRPTGAETGVSMNRNVRVASLGGGGGTSGGVGYGKGEHAGVKGQGGSFVSMDTGGSSVEEGLTKDEVGEVIHKHLSEVRYCYESAMIRSPDIEGKLMVSFTIGGTGSVKNSEVKSSTLSDARLDDCILRRLGTWKFPNPRGGIDVAVTYPFIFKTLGR